MVEVERLADDKVRAIFDARERSSAAGLDLLRSAREVRRPPDLPVA